MSSTNHPPTLDPFVESVLASEIQDQCIFALMAHNELARADHDPRSPTEHTWYALQNFLVAAANISKLLWGTKAVIEKRRAALRDKLGIDDTFAIKDRDLRNDFEHFDERVEKKCSQTHIFVGRIIGPPWTVNVGPKDDHFQWYDPETGRVSFWTHSVCVPTLLREIQFLFPRAQALASA